MVDDAFDVGDEDVLALETEADQQVEAGECRGAGTTADQLDLLDVLADDLEAVEDAGGDDDRGAVLVIVEHRDGHALLELALDLEALRRLDVLEIDAAEGRLEPGDRFDEFVDVGRIDLDVEDIDAGELLEQDGLAFHHRFRGERADVAQAEYGRAVGHDADEVAASGETRCHRGIVGDGGAGMRNAGRVSQREVVLVGNRFGRLDRDFAGRILLVIGERVATEFLLRHGVLSGPSRDRCIPASRPHPVLDV